MQKDPSHFSRMLALALGNIGPMLGLHDTRGKRIVFRKRPNRDPNEPAQAARILAAETKRKRKAEWLHYTAGKSADQNRAHCDEFDNLHDRLNPFCINRSTTV